MTEIYTHEPPGERWNKRDHLSSGVLQSLRFIPDGAQLWAAVKAHLSSDGNEVGKRWYFRTLRLAFQHRGGTCSEIRGEGVANGKNCPPQMSVKQEVKTSRAFQDYLKSTHGSNQAELAVTFGVERTYIPTLSGHHG